MYSNLKEVSFIGQSRPACGYIPHSFAPKAINESFICSNPGHRPKFEFFGRQPTLYQREWGKDLPNLHVNGQRLTNMNLMGRNKFPLIYRSASFQGSRRDNMEKVGRNG